MRKRNWGTYILLCFFAALFIFSGGMIVRSLIIAKNEQSDIDKLVDQVTDVQPADPQPVTDPDAEKAAQDAAVLARYAELYAQNSDFGGWITIDDTKINFPVMFTPSNYTYYIHKNFEKKYSHNGLPFIGLGSTLDPRSDNVLIYGHNMQSGAMFADLTKFEKEEFWETHKTIEFDTVNERDEYEIVAVFKFTLSDADKVGFYEFTNAESAADFDAYVKYCTDRALYDTGVTATYGDKLLTLSTCSNHAKNGRLIILARQKGSTTE